MMKIYNSHPMSSDIVEIKDGVSPTVVSKWHKAAADGVLVLFESHGADSRYNQVEQAPTLVSRMGTGGGNVPILVYTKEGHPRCSDEPQQWRETDVAKTLNTFNNTEARAEEVVVCVQENVIGRGDNSGANGKGAILDQSFTLNSTGVHAVAYRVSSYESNCMKSSNPSSGIKEVDISPTLDATTPGADKAQGGLAICDTQRVPISDMAVSHGTSDNRCAFGVGQPGDPAQTITSAHHNAVGVGYQVRRLTPVECERLQGFPDNWTRIPYRGKPEDKCPDSPRYKAIGNSWAVPCVRWIGNRINEALR